MISRTIRQLKQRRAKPEPPPAVKRTRIAEAYVTIRPNTERFAQAHDEAAGAFRQLADLSSRRFAPGDRAYTLPLTVRGNDFRQAPIDEQCRWALALHDHAGVTVTYGCEKYDGHAGEHRSSFVTPEQVGDHQLAWAEPA